MQWLGWFSIQAIVFSFWQKCILDDLQFKYAVLTRESGDLDDLQLKYSVLVRQNKEMVVVFAEKMVTVWRRTRIEIWRL